MLPTELEKLEMLGKLGYCVGHLDHLSLHRNSGKRFTGFTTTKKSHKTCHYPQFQISKKFESIYWIPVNVSLGIFHSTSS